jgi:hypothetical protein
MTFIMGTVYDFNLNIDGTLYAIKARFTGMGETDANGVDIGYFTRVLSDGQDGYTFKWSKDKACAMQPNVWAEERAEF